MSAISMVAGNDLRRRWRGTIAVALLVGIVGAVVLATLAGARRSSSALRRFQDYSQSANLEVQPGFASPDQIADFERQPGVAKVGVVELFAVGPQNALLGHLAIGAPADDTMGMTVDRARVIKGRAPNPAAPDEVAIGEGLAAIAHLHVGSTLGTVSWSPQQVARIGRSGNFEAPEGIHVPLQVVGIVRRPLDLADRGGAGGVVLLTRAFARTYAHTIGNFAGDALRVRTAHGTADVAMVSAEARRIFDSSPNFQIQPLAIETAGARDAINVLTTALLIFAGLAALAGVVAIAIVLTRELSLTDLDRTTLRALGTTRRQRLTMAGVRVGLIAGAGGAIAVLGAIAASPLLPFGVARRADPDAGLHADWLVLALGALGVVMVVGFVGATAIVRAARGTRAGTRRSKLSARAVDFGAGVGFPTSATAGLQMVTEPGRGPHAVPLRSAFFGAILGVLGLTSVVVVAASLDHLAATRRMYGWTFDFKLEQVDNPTCAPHDDGISKMPGIATLSTACYMNVEIDGRAVAAWKGSAIKGNTPLPLVAGRAPATAREVALGASTLGALHKHIGDIVHGTGPKGAVAYRIVGQIVFPQIGDPQPLADGAWFTADGFADQMTPNSEANAYLVGSYTPGADRAQLARLIATRTPEIDPIGGPAVPAEIERLRQINWFPLAIAGLLAVLALVAVGHALVTGTRRRRRELAVLKTLGFDRGQVRATIGWQATVLAAVGLAFGIPLGLVTGIAVWRTIADALGVSDSPVVPTVLLLLIPAAVVAVNAVAFFPARAAARVRAAVALHTE